MVLTCTTRIRHKGAPTRMIIPHHARNGKKKAKFANAASHDTWKEQKRRTNEGHTWILKWIQSQSKTLNPKPEFLPNQGDGISSINTHTFMRPCEVSKSPNTDDTLLFPSKVILDPHLQILLNSKSVLFHGIYWLMYWLPNQLYYMTI